MGRKRAEKFKHAGIFSHDPVDSNLDALFKCTCSQVSALIGLKHKN